MKTALLVIALIALLCGAAAFAGYIWQSVGEVEMSGHGYFAMTLGILLSLALGVGLMFLVFFSSRRGHDEDVGR